MADITASFRVMSEDLDSDEVSRVLGLSPHHTHLRGSPRIGHSGHRYSDFSEGLWELRSVLGVSEPLDAHLRGLATILEVRKEALSRLRDLGHELDIFVGIFDEGGNTMIKLKAETLARISNIDVPLIFDVYT